MSQNPQQGSFADALHDAADVFAAPDTVSLYGAAVQRGRQIRRRRAGAVLGGTVALGTTGVLAFALSAAASHGNAVATANGGTPTAGGVAPGPSYARPTAAPAIRPGGITGSVIQGALEYALPSSAQVIRTGGPGNVNVEVVDPDSHSWYVQTSVTIKSSGQLGTLVAVTVTHTAGSDTCSALDQTSADGHGQCTRSTVDGGQLLDDVVPLGTGASDGVFEFFEWVSPAGYRTDLELQDDTVADFALTKAQAEALLTDQVFADVARALPADACLGGSFSQPVDPPTPGQSPLQHVRCSSDGNLYPTY